VCRISRTRSLRFSCAARGESLTTPGAHTWRWVPVFPIRRSAILNTHIQIHAIAAENRMPSASIRSLAGCIPLQPEPVVNFPKVQYPHHRAVGILIWHGDCQSGQCLCSGRLDLGAKNGMDAPCAPQLFESTTIHSISNIDATRGMIQ
jgi:hypothetical protein